MSKVTQEIEKIVEPIIAPLGFETVDVELFSEAGKRVLRIYIDTISGSSDSRTQKSVTLDDCARVSAVVGDALDKISNIDALKEHYILEISSPGITRVLKKPKDFVRFKGKLARVSLFEPINGSRNFVGRILNFENDVLTIALPEAGGTASFTLKAIARARLEPEF